MVLPGEEKAGGKWLVLSMYINMIGGSKEEPNLPVMPSDRTRGNGHKSKFSLNMRKTFLL